MTMCMGQVSTGMLFHFKEKKRVTANISPKVTCIDSSKGPKNTALLESSNSPIKPKPSTFHR